MGITASTQPIFGVQFHPESILTDGGYRMFANFSRAAGRSNRVSSATVVRRRSGYPTRPMEKPLPATPVTF